MDLLTKSNFQRNNEVTISEKLMKQRFEVDPILGIIQKPTLSTGPSLYSIDYWHQNIANARRYAC